MCLVSGVFCSLCTGIFCYLFKGLERQWLIVERLGLFIFTDSSMWIKKGTKCERFWWVFVTHNTFALMSLVPIYLALDKCDTSILQHLIFLSCTLIIQSHLLYCYFWKYFSLLSFILLGSASTPIYFFSFYFSGLWDF